MKKLVALFILISQQVLASPLPEFPFVAVTGESEVEVEPDQATITFYIETFSETSQTASTDLNDTVIKAVKLILDNGVSESSLSSFAVDKRTVRQQTQGYQDTEILGYEVSQQFQFTLLDISKYPALVQALLEVDRISGVNGEFDLSNRVEVEKRLILEAATKAESKAKMMAEGLGVKLGTVYAVNDSGSYSSFFATFGLDVEALSIAGAMMHKPAPTVFVPKTIKISKSINVVYKLDV